jgi:steroid 5-alpha reductase family enzyme
MVVRLLLVNLVLIIAYMTAWFVLAKRRQRLDTVDSAWGGGFALAAWAVVAQVPSPATLAIAGLVSIWCVRLTAHLVRRSRRPHDDPRYTEMAAKWKRNFWLKAYLWVFLLQGLLVWVVSLPIVMAAGTMLDDWAWLILGGSTVWLAGYIIESAADRQLAAFVANKNNKANKNNVLDSGWWRYSRHPNYFGELVQWWGIAIIALQASWGWVGLLGPLVLTYLIIFVSGIPPIEKRRRDNKAYQAYKKRTSPLVPWPPKRA